MNSTFQYSVLKYRHSFLLNEVVNVGLLLYFPEERIIKFIYPFRLNRISGLYSNFDIGTIKTVQGIFDSRCNELNQEWSSLNKSLLAALEPPKFENIISDYFLVEDASSLYFDIYKNGVNVGINKILSHYYEEYFSCYSEHAPHIHKKDEKYIEQRIKSQLKSNLKNSNNKISLEINKEISLGLISERFKLGWRNGSENLIAPIAFDLLETETIKQKSLSWFGKLSFLGEYAKANNISFHILTSKPSDKSLFKAYDNALKVIEKANAPKEIYEDKQIDEYANYIIEYLSENENNQESPSN